ncbi:formate dehydrogenase subunit gamma [Kaistia geumhonensis]|uniref:Formate dehydrogenase subunit gamma n=1 Tax=Kaistia geumhonensis TaxID=410839 RepID=A0ABU0M4C8_9HYPH|nr:formate dehydrogenase subunit gamma [Kaistia geumhonensis]MCX5478967.1 formate dehydrogenase subunit gamma [Kaistia geumhonensis]MDQ0515814.1 formate dehydrogenase subunit gamma [Kaistia geumhonensis]
MQETEERTAAIVARFAGVEGATLPILHAVQEAFGHVPRESIPVIAAALNRTRAEIHGVVSFYHDFREEPAGRHIVRVCRAEACRAMGSDRIAGTFETALGVALGETSADGAVTLEPVYCLGLCATAPSAMIDGKPVGRLDEAAAARLAREIGR